MNSLDQAADTLRQLNLQIRHDMEQSELKASQVDDLVRQLGQTGLLCDRAILGGFFKRTLPDSRQIVQAALLVNRGLGVCVWDEEEFCLLQDSPEGLTSHAYRVFKPISDCNPAEKAHLCPFIDELIEDFADIALAAAARHDDRYVSMPAPEYFASRRESQDTRP